MNRAIGHAYHRGEIGTVYAETSGYMTVETSRGRFYMKSSRVQWRAISKEEK